jgi:hypothetical protein
LKQFSLALASCVGLWWRTDLIVVVSALRADFEPPACAQAAARQAGSTPGSALI